MVHGQEPRDAVVAEKRREDAIRDEDWHVTRWVWSELDPRGNGIWIGLLQSVVFVAAATVFFRSRARFTAATAGPAPAAPPATMWVNAPPSTAAPSTVANAHERKPWAVSRK